GAGRGGPGRAGGAACPRGGRGEAGGAAGEPLELGGRRGERRAHPLRAADLAQDGEPREGGRALVAVEGQGEGPPHTAVVEGLALVVDGDGVPAFPGALLHRDAIPPGPD